MIKVSGSGGTGGARPTRGVAGAKGPAGAFRVDDPVAAGLSTGAAPVGETASAAALGALIAIQSEGRSGARNQAAADRLLMLLERLRDGLLAGRIAVADLAAIADAADAKLTDPDQRIAALFEEISLRARVELAKIGR